MGQTRKNVESVCICRLKYSNLTVMHGMKNVKYSRMTNIKNKTSACASLLERWVLLRVVWINVSKRRGAIPENFCSTATPLLSVARYAS